MGYCPPFHKEDAMKQSPAGPRKHANLSKSLNQQLNSYAMVATAAGVGMLALSQTAAAKIIYTGAHVVLGERSNAHYLLDLNHDGIKDFKLTHFFSNTGRYFGSSMRIEDYKNHANRIVTSSSPEFDDAIALPAGVKVGPSARFLSFANVARAAGTNPSGSVFFFMGQWANSGNGLKNRYLGLRFIIQGQAHFGWARLSVSKYPFAATLTGYAYETIPNKPIITGKTDVPDVMGVQPGTLGHLAAGASAIPTSRSGR